MINHVNEKREPTVLMLCDAEKAFDRVQWDFLECVFAKMKFGSGFRRWIGLIYDKQEAAIHLGETKLQSFAPHRGVRQGCPRPLLFLIYS